jgi:HlyD family secretion protein
MGMDRAIERRTWTWKRIAWVAGGVLLLAFTLYELIFAFKGSTLRVEEERLTISTVVRAPFQEFIPIVGNVLPRNTIYLDAVEGGRVEEIYADAGSMVKKGDRILKLGNTSLLLDIMWREAELFQQSNNLRSTRLSMEQYQLNLSQELADVENQLTQQKRIYQRDQELMKDQLISQQTFELARDQYEYLIKKRDLTVESQKKELEFRRTQIDALDQSLKSMQDNLKIAKSKLEDLTIKAPVSGYLTALNAEIGQSKALGERLGQIDILDGFKVRADIDEHYIGRVVEGKVGDFDLSDRTYRVEVKKIYPEVKDGKFEVDLDFESAVPEGIRRGQTVHIRLQLSDVSEEVLLPRGGFYQNTGGNWAFVLDPSGKTAVRRNIRLGRQNPEFFEVLEGLHTGDRVITSSYDAFGDMERLILTGAAAKGS